MKLCVLCVSAFHRCLCAGEQAGLCDDTIWKRRDAEGAEVLADAAAGLNRE